MELLVLRLFAHPLRASLLRRLRRNAFKLKLTPEVLSPNEGQ